MIVTCLHTAIITGWVKHFHGSLVEIANKLTLGCASNISDLLTRWEAEHHCFAALPAVVVGRAMVARQAGAVGKMDPAGIGLAVADQQAAVEQSL